jgi:GT2 family glycosyltransferase
VIVELADAPDVVAVVPTLGGNVPRLLACLESVAGSDFPGRLAVIVVWNDPRRVPPDLGMVTLLEPGLNLGFPGALNHARSRVHADFLWVLQDDVVVRGDCLARLWEAMAGDGALGVVSPVALDERGLIPARTRGGVFNPDGTMAYSLPTLDTDPADFDGDRPDWVSSSASLARMSAWDAVGGYDPTFFPLLWSDVDFGYRLGKAGFGSALEPTARITHEVNGSTPGVLVRFLAEVQRDRFLTKNFGAEPVPSRAAGADPVLVAAVAQSASLGMVDLASFATALERESHAEIRRLAQEAAGLAGELGRMRATLSWRVTAPLRVARRLVGRRR